MNEADIVGRYVVSQDGGDTDFRVSLERTAPEIGVRVHGRNEGGHFGRVVRIADVGSAHARVELGREDDLLEEGRPELLVRRVRTEPAAAVAEMAAGCRYLVRRHRLRPARIRDVHQERNMPDLDRAEARRRFRGADYELAVRADVVPRVG